MMEKFDILADI